MKKLTKPQITGLVRLYAEESENVIDVTQTENEIILMLNETSMKRQRILTLWRDNDMIKLVSDITTYY